MPLFQLPLLSLSHTHSLSHTRSLSHSLSLIHSLSLSLTHTFSHTHILSHSLSFTPSLSLSRSLSLSLIHSLILSRSLSLSHSLSLTHFAVELTIPLIRSLDILKLIGCQLPEEEYYKLKPLRVRVLDLSEADHFTDRVAEELLGEETPISEAILVRCPQFTDEGLFKLSTKLKVRHSPHALINVLKMNS